MSKQSEILREEIKLAKQLKKLLKEIKKLISDMPSVSGVADLAKLINATDEPPEEEEEDSDENGDVFLRSGEDFEPPEEEEEEESSIWKEVMPGIKISHYKPIMPWDARLIDAVIFPWNSLDLKL